MIDLQNYMLFYEHLYDYPGNVNNLLDTIGKQLPLLAGDLNLVKMEINIDMPRLFCDRFPFSFHDTIFNTGEETDSIPVTTNFTTDHDGLITITAYSKKGIRWTRDQVRDIIFLNEQIMVLISRSRLQSQLKKAEETDIVTNCLNLAGIMHVGELLSVKKLIVKFSVLALNINGFAALNEKYGHTNGDAILKSYASGISTFIGKDGVIGRIDADNFIVVLSTARVKDLVNLLKTYSVHAEFDDMTEQTLLISSRIGICDGTSSAYFPQLVVNSKIALKRTSAGDGLLVERF